MIDELDGAPLPNGDAHDFPKDVPVYGATPLAIAKPKKKKRKKTLKAKRDSVVLQLRESQATTALSTTVPMQQERTSEEAPSLPIVRSGGGFDRGWRFPGGSLRRAQAALSDGATPAQHVAGAVCVDGSQGDHVTWRHLAWAAVLVVIVGVAIALA